MQRHLHCSEQFYRECVLTDIKTSEKKYDITSCFNHFQCSSLPVLFPYSVEDKMKMMEMLQRFEADSVASLEGAGSVTPTLEERLAGLDISE